MMATIQTEKYAVCCWDGAVGIDRYRGRVLVDEFDAPSFARSKDGQDKAVFAFFFVQVDKKVVKGADNPADEYVVEQEESTPDDKLHFPGAVIIADGKVPAGWMAKRFGFGPEDKDEMTIRCQDGDYRIVPSDRSVIFPPA